MSTPTMPLTDPQRAAIAKLACGLEAGDALALLCGPAGVGKTTVLAHLAASLAASGRSASSGDPRGWLDSRTELPDVVVVDDAHLADTAELADVVARARSRRPAAAVVLAGEGRLLTLVSRDRRLAAAASIRVALLPGRLGDTASLLARRAGGGPGFEEPVVAAIHEITGGVLADIVRLAALADVVAAAQPDRRLAVVDVEAIHRRLFPSAA